MLEDVYFISMEGKKDFKIGDFKVREDISLPVYIKNKENFSIDDINPDNVINGMIKVLAEDPENDNIDYYRSFIFSIKPDIEASLSSVAYEAEYNNDYDEALKIYKLLLALKNESIDQYLNLAVCHDEYSQYLYNMGMENKADKEEESAYEYYIIIDNFENKNDRAYYYLGRFYLSRENYEKAIEYFREFIKKTADSDRKSEVIQVIKDISTSGYMDDDYKTASELLLADKDKEAVDYIDRYLEKYPKSWNGYYLKGIAFKKINKPQDAIAYFEYALKFNPDSVDIFNEIGLCYMDLKIYHKSKQYFYKALKNNPDDLVILSNLAVMEYKKGDKEEAIKYCNVILEFNPDDINTKNLLKKIENNEI